MVCIMWFFESCVCGLEVCVMRADIGLDVSWEWIQREAGSDRDRQTDAAHGSRAGRAPASATCLQEPNEQPPDAKTIGDGPTWWLRVRHRHRLLLDEYRQAEAAWWVGLGDHDGCRLGVESSRRKRSQSGGAPRLSEGRCGGDGGGGGLGLVQKGAATL
ncbi:hypothetical protein BC567DRAFT_226833 [Phyllosticta citribraziliensis]